MQNCLIEKRDVISSGVKKSSSITQETEIWVQLLIKSHFNRQMSSIYNLYNLTIVFYSFHITVQLHLRHNKTPSNVSKTTQPY